MKNNCSELCALCNQSLPPHSISNGIHRFCCMGCHAVFNILTTKNQLEGYEQHPLFLQALQSGLISNPALLDHIQRQKIQAPANERERIYFEVEGLWCPSCAEFIRLMLLKEQGILSCTIDYTTDLASIEFSPRYISKNTIFEIIREIGYLPLPLENGDRKAVSTALYVRFIIAAFCSLNIMMLAYPLYATYFDYDGEGYGMLFAWLSLLVSLPAVSYCAWPIWKKFFHGLTIGFLGMETLVAIGVGAAFAFSLMELLSHRSRVYFDSMSLIITFVLLGKIIEAKAKFSAKGTLLHLIRSMPRRGRKRLQNGELLFVPIKEIAKGDLLVAYHGEKIILDGVIVEGEGACDESLMTGESIPVVKKIGDSVLGGGILAQGSVTYKVINDLEETALHHIIQMVERDLGHKASYVRAADKIVRWFVPLVICLACFTGIFYLLFSNSSDGMSHQSAILCFLAVLLISCPCAIGIAVPTVESYLLNSLAAIGGIVRNRGCLSYLGKETVIVLDKTGTVTEGKFTLRSGLEGLKEDERIALRSIASLSTHPIARAIATAGKVPLIPVSSIEEIAGYGLCGNISGRRYYLGSERFFQRQGIVIPSEETLSNQEGILTCVYFAEEERYIARLELGDQIRTEAKELIEKLRKDVRFILLSGDAESPVAAVADACGVAEWHARCTPLEKREFVDTLKSQGEIVCMLGDGINDAPALTAAHIGISVVAAADMSIQVSDVLLATDRLSTVYDIRRISRKAQKITKENLFWAFFYNVIGIFLAMVGVLSPIFAAFAMSISSLTVLLNAQRVAKPL